MAKIQQVSIVLPAFNEADDIAHSLDQLEEFCRSYEHPPEVIIVDDGSSDSTAAIVESKISTWGSGSQAPSRLRLLRKRHNRGKGSSVRMGMLASQGAYMVFTDADLAFGTRPIADAVEKLEEGFDVVTANRDQRVGLSRRIIGSLFAWTVRLAQLSHVDDSQAGLKGFTRDAAQILFGLSQIEGFAFDIEIIHIARIQNMRMGHICVRIISSSGTSIRPRHVLDMVRDLWRIRALSKRDEYQVPAPKPRARKLV